MQRMAECLCWLEHAALNVLDTERDCFADEPPLFTLISPLASGADQFAADAALRRGWCLQAVLPMSGEDYADSMGPPDATELRNLIERSRCIFELPGRAADPLAAFVMSGRATVAHCDILLALWDGLPARGRGGTAETIDRALIKGTPIVHLPIAPDQPARLLWSAFDPVVITAPGDRVCGRPADREALAAVVRALLAPPGAEVERRFIQRFFNERPRSLSLRLEYPMLMTLVGSRGLRSSDLRARTRVEAARAEWDSYRQDCLGRHGVDAPLEQLQIAYEWSDRLASHFAQTYRSSHVFNFLLAALGAWIGLSGLVLTGNPMLLALAEFAVVLAVVVNTLIGSRRCWHQRWLDYRQLAERLRPMRSLKLLGIAAPDPPGTAAEPVARRWIDWYAACMWRTIGCPAGRLGPADLPGLAEAIAKQELEPQIGYNRGNANQVDRFDRRLELLAMGLFLSTMAVTFSVIIGLEFFPAAVNAAGNWVTVLSAGLPALGTAIFGIRVQGDYGALAARSRTTAGLLERIATDLRRSRDLPRMADLTEQASRVMLADLGEWRLVNELHDLSLA